MSRSCQGRSRKRTGAAGFTLIELLMTIVIASILLAIAVPSFRDFVLNSRRSAAVNQVLATLQFGRSEVLKRGGRVTVCSSADGATCADPANWSAGWLVFANSAEDCTVDGGAGDTVIKFVPNETDGITLTSSRTCYSFRGFNLSGPSAGTITFCDPRAASVATQRRAVVVDTMGRARTSLTDLNNAALVCS